MWSCWAIVALLAAGAIAPVASAQPVSLAGSPSGQSALSAHVTWDGTDVGSYATPTAALSTSFSSTIDVHYTWGASAGPSGAPGLFTISDARLQLFYFGVALSTRDVIESNPVAAPSGVIDMAWSGGYLEWATAGTYRLTASLLAPNGTQMWAESFYIHVAAPYSILAALPLLLILVAAYEIYSLLTAGRLAGRKPSAPPAPPPATPPPAATPTPPSDGAPPPPGRSGAP
ncbi:MAG: hypothetical protein ACYDFT_06110 [Thermoplasmata archaeon]